MRELLAQTELKPRDAFRTAIGAKHMTPLWEVLHDLVTAIPRSPLEAAVWHYTEVRGDLLRAGNIISAEEAERRVLILENPALRGRSCITQTLYAGLQVIMPGEVARSHRHTQSALRVVMDGVGAYTTVDGERRTMHRGDFIITPSWTWHDHGNLGVEPVVWLDGLDIPLVGLLDASFSESGQVASQTEARPQGDALARYGNNMLPLELPNGAVPRTPLFVYPYERTVAALQGVSHGQIDAHVGFKLRYVDPITGKSPIASIGTYAQFLPRGFETLGYRSSDSMVYLCLEGTGKAQANAIEFAIEPNDVFVVPSWHTLRVKADRELTLFSYSDRPIQQMLGLWREERDRV